MKLIYGNRRDLFQSVYGSCLGNSPPYVCRGSRCRRLNPYYQGFRIIWRAR